MTALPSRALPTISLTGFAETGKSEVAKYLVSRYGYFRPAHIKTPMMNMAGPLLRSMGIDNPIEIHDRLDGPRKNEPIPGFPTITGRLILQAIGDPFKLALDPTGEFFLNLWWDQAVSQCGGAPILNESLRFPTEIPFMRKKRSVLIEVTRPGKGPNNPKYEPHIPGDVVINNVWNSFPPLYDAVDKALADVSWMNLTHD